MNWSEFSKSTFYEQEPVRKVNDMTNGARAAWNEIQSENKEIDKLKERKYKELCTIQAERVEQLETALQRIESWANAYPLKIFPEPDFKKVAEVLKAAGLSLDAVSASNMRHVIVRVKNIVTEALKGGE